jgi:hypothetical protein
VQSARLKVGRSVLRVVLAIVDLVERFPQDRLLPALAANVHPLPPGTLVVRPGLPRMLFTDPASVTVAGAHPRSLSQGDAAMLGLVTRIKTSFSPTHIAIAIPFDSDADFRSHGTTPSPRSAEVHYQKWCDTIHAAGIKWVPTGEN